MLTLRQQAACGRIQSRGTVRIPLTIVRFKRETTVEPDSRAVPAATDNSITLVYNGNEEKLRLINNKVHLSAVKEAFNLKTVKLNGQLEPVDQLGFTVVEFTPGQTVVVSGSPVAELEKLHAEVAALRAELQSLHELRDDLRNVATLSSQFNSTTSSYDEMKRCLLSPGVSAEDLTIIKRLLAEMVLGSKDGPDFTKTSQDGYTFDTWWEGRMLAKDIVNTHTDIKKKSHGTGRYSRHHHDDLDHEEVLSSFHAT